MKKNFVLIAALIAALTVAFVSCGDDGVVSGTGDKTPQVQQFDLETGMTTGITTRGSATFGSGIISFAHVTAAGPYDDGAGFSIAATGATTAATCTITIKYICKVVSGAPKFTLKNGLNAAEDWFGGDATAATAGGQYVDLKAGVVDELVLKGSGFTNPATGIGLQRNGDANGFYMKILSVTVAGATAP
jgi:hypothetical protein